MSGQRPSGPVVEVTGLRVRYPGGRADAVAAVSFSLRGGEVVGLLGANGAGKTTVCRSLNGIVPQLVEAEVGGRITVADHDVGATPVSRLAPWIAVVLDEPRAQLSQGTAGEEVALGLESLGTPYAEMVERVDDALEQVGLAGLGDRPPLALSGGQQQRLVIAAAIAVRPRVLVLDEATAGLDPAGREAVLALLRRLADEQGMAVLVVDHDVESLVERADRLLVLRDGALVADGAPAAVLDDVRELAAAGVGVPDVAAVASALRERAMPRRGGPLPVTLDEGRRWLEASG